MRLSPISRADLIRRLRELGWEGPYPGGRHQYMVNGPVQIPIPNPHRGDIGPNFLARILREAGISRAEWIRL